MNKIRFALIGCGRITSKHVIGFANNIDVCKLVGVCDIIEENAVAKKEEYINHIPDAEINVYTDYKKMLDDKEIDAVSIATESGYHEEIAIECIKRGKHVIVEKPMAMTVDGCLKMIDEAKKNNVKLGVCHQNRFNPPIQALREAVEKGRFGKIYAGNARILWNRNEGYYSQASWRGTRELDGGCLMNQCIHNIDILQWMLGGDPVKINAMLENFCHPYIEMEDYGSMQIKFANGAIGNVEGTVAVFSKNLKETLTIIGEKGTVKIGGLAVNKLEHWKFEDAYEGEEDDMKQKLNGEIDNVYGYGHTPLFKDFVCAIKEDKKPYIAGEDGIESVKIILAGYDQNYN